jgi:hypothetical protein
VGKVQTPDPLWVGRTKDAVNTALAAKGWTQVDSGGQVAIVAVEMTKNQQTLNTFYDGFGGAGAGDVSEVEDSERRLQRQIPTKSAPSSLTFSMRTARSWSGEGQPAILCPISLKRISRTLIRVCRRCSITSPRVRTNKQRQCISRPRQAPNQGASGSIDPIREVEQDRCLWGVAIASAPLHLVS